MPIFTKLLRLVTKILDGKYLLTNSSHTFGGLGFLLYAKSLGDLKKKRQSLSSCCLSGNEI